MNNLITILFSPNINENAFTDVVKQVYDAGYLEFAGFASAAELDSEEGAYYITLRGGLEAVKALGIDTEGLELIT